MNEKVQYLFFSFFFFENELKETTLNSGKFLCGVIRSTRVGKVAFFFLFFFPFFQYTILHPAVSPVIGENIEKDWWNVHIFFLLLSPLFYSEKSFFITFLILTIKKNSVFNSLRLKPSFLLLFYLFLFYFLLYFVILFFYSIFQSIFYSIFLFYLFPFYFLIYFFYSIYFYSTYFYSTLFWLN